MTRWSGRGDDGDVGSLQLALQHIVGTQLAVELEQGDVLDQAGQVDRRFHAGVAATDHRHALALEQRAIAMRAIGHALVAVLVLAGHVHLPPARAGGQDHRPAFQGGAVGQLDLDHATGGAQLLGALQVHDIDLVLTHVLLELRDQPGAFGFGYRDEILDRHRVQHLATEAFGNHAGADALASRIDRPRRAAGPPPTISTS